ncbi:uncharacterized protein FA14DRAFT_156027 [Meira miltonrushii]|uniref:Uncharacterized protein n=1 Tax=Meira miltonrushii TaxID=1280837 RepID=A0A316VA55_9BASI|nr:uncharacterized protein FA14DRAFT_156027 [Meira miltonrushii]PWN33331.1 hypothetical protein FA14DRAFT_156027 [Meira miltonrushii]
MLLASPIVLLLFFVNLSNAVESVFIKRTEPSQNAGDNHQTIANVRTGQVCGLDLNSSPPRNVESHPTDHQTNLDIPSISQKSTPNRGRPKKYFTEAEKRRASTDRKNRWSRKYSVKGIEKANKTLEGDELHKFLQRAEDHQAKMKKRNQLYREKYQKYEKIQKKDIDLNSYPKAYYNRKRGRPQKYANDEERRKAEAKRKKIYNMKYTLEGVEIAKATMQGDELQSHLLKAEDLHKKRRDYMRRMRLRDRLRTGQ